MYYLVPQTSLYDLKDLIMANSQKILMSIWALTYIKHIGFTTTINETNNYEDIKHKGYTTT